MTPCGNSVLILNAGEGLKSNKMIEKPPTISKSATTPEKDSASSGSVCTLSFDAVVNIRNEIYFFKVTAIVNYLSQIFESTGFLYTRPYQWLILMLFYW